ncbi:MAG: protein phosphatase 2C domain-containing protein [Pseudomonadales bacterium]|nr:protein phosphatase 2C domain-containing protein [Pseudomonadales bacterium]
MHQYGEGTHVGNVRDNNEDSYVCDSSKELWIVADGMGGLGFGEVASAISTYTVQSQLREGHGINQAIELAHKKIKEFAATEAQGTNMGTTLVLLLSQGSLYNIFWVGDSRAYSFDGQLKQITVDHSLVQNLIEQGEITPEEAAFDSRKNAVTRALGVQELETVRADSISDKWLPNQKILLCSDGLTDCVDDKTIQAILSEEGSDQSKVDNLISKALKQGGKDNITVLLISAPESARKADSDTHVPESVGGSVHTGNDTQRRLNFHIESPTTQLASPLQLEMEVNQIPTLHETIDLPPEVAQKQSAVAPPSIWARKQKWIIAAILSLAMFLFARLTTADKTEAVETPFSTGELIEQNTVSSMPTSLPLPNVNWPVPGTVIQMGVYSKLVGAESQQTELNQLGFSPYVEKKLENGSVLYAVLLGPFTEHSDTQAVKRKLEVSKLAFFERPDSRY